MNRTMRRSFSWMAAGLAALIAASLVSVVSAQHTITFLGKTTDQTDYSPTGMNVGTAGFWFAQFNQSTFVSNAAVNSNHVDQFPSWILPNYNSGDATANTGYSFASTAYSEGGDLSWNTLKLPNSLTGLSGALVDSNSANNSSNTIPQLLFGAGTPLDFLMHVVVDNESLTSNPHRDATRIEARGGFPAPSNGSSTNLIHAPGVAGFNGTADVYTFRYVGWLPGEIIKLRLNSGIAGERGGIAGLMFDVVPEPTSMLLLGFGTIGFAGTLARRRHG